MKLGCAGAHAQLPPRTNFITLVTPESVLMPTLLHYSDSVMNFDELTAKKQTNDPLAFRHFGMYSLDYDKTITNRRINLDSCRINFQGSNHYSKDISVCGSPPRFTPPKNLITLVTFESILMPTLLHYSHCLMNFEFEEKVMHCNFNLALDSPMVEGLNALVISLQRKHVRNITLNLKP